MEFFMTNRFAIILLALVAIFLGIFFISKGKSSDSNGSNSAQASSHTQGAGKKGVTLVEYGDFQCPACTAYHPLIKQVVEKYKEDITFQFVNYPLVSIHPNAMAAHRAAEAAHKQNKYWEMHDLLYERHDEWATSSTPTTFFEGYATQLSLNIDQFKQDSSSSSVNDIINADIKKGQALRLQATPTFYINDKKITDNPQDAAGFEKLIQDAINEKNKQ